MDTQSGETTRSGSWGRAGTAGSVGGSTGGTTGGTGLGPDGSNQGGSQYGTQYGQGADGQTNRPENLTDHARETVHTLADAARNQATSRISEQKTRAANTLGGVASALHVAGQQIRDQEGSPAAPYVQRAADEIDRLANYLDRVELNEVVNEVETFARRNQALFLGGAFLLGVLGARFLKSSTRHDDYAGTSPGYPSVNYGGAGRQSTYDRSYDRTLPPATGSGYGDSFGRDANDTMRSSGQSSQPGQSQSSQSDQFGTSTGYSDRGNA